MKIAILEPNEGQLSIYAYEFCEFKPDLFYDLNVFLLACKGQYDVVILPHRIDGISWKKIYLDTTNNTTNTRYIVTSTFEPDDYKAMEPEIYKQLEEIRQFPNVHLKQKDEYSKIYDLIEGKKSFLNMRQIALSLIAA